MTGSGRKMRLASALCLAAVLASPAPAVGTDAASCHCFRDRSFDPSRPSAADAYILATARNSLLSAALGVSKRELVMAEMGGASPDDLWVAHWAARRLERDADELLSRRQAGGSWEAALGGAGAGRLGAAFEKALGARAPDAALGSVAVDDVVMLRLRIPEAAVAALRAAGASSSETVVASLLALRTGRRPEELLALARRGPATWGTLLREAGLAPRDVEAAIRQAVR